MRWLGVVLLAAGPAGNALAQEQPTGWTDRSPHRVEFVSVAPGVRLEVLDWGGSGPPLVFLSGLQDVAHGFDELAPQFTRDHHVLAITRRGYGASSQPDSGYNLKGRVADLRAVFDSLDLSRVSLVGHSIAGDELTGFAGAYPERVSSLIYLDAAYDHSNLTELLGKFPPPPPMAAGDSASPRAVQAYLQRMYGMLIPEAQLRAIGRYDANGHLVGDVTPARIDSLILAGCGHPEYRAVHAPALVIYAVVDSLSQVFPYYDALSESGRKAARALTAGLQRWSATERRRVRRELSGAQILELHGANHYVFDSNRAQVVRSMRAFLAKNRAPGD
jgi:pimeloyl-ACP methyl ester carboxylesterase